MITFKLGTNSGSIGLNDTIIDKEIKDIIATKAEKIPCREIKFKRKDIKGQNI